MKKYFLSISAAAVIAAFGMVAQVEAAPLNLTHTLSVGSTGVDVSALQQFLKDWSYFTYPTITSYFGPITKSAVISFQSAFGIDPIGIAGPITRAKIFALTSASTTATSTETGVLLPKIIYYSGSSHHSDHIPPSAPTDVSSSDVGQSSLSLSWTASTDTGGSNLAGYLVERCAGGGCTSFAQVGAPSLASFDDFSLNSGTLYRYRVRAVDGAGNLSAYSSILDVTTMPTLFPLSVFKSGSGDGTVTSDLSDIDCGSDCSAQEASGTVVTLTATPAAGSTFTGWSGEAGCTGTGTCVATVDEPSDAIATFTLNDYTLTVNKIGTGSGTVVSTPAGISCSGSGCTNHYSSGTMVTLSPTTAVGSVFAGWSGACSGTGSCSVSMSTDQTVNATFNAVSYPLTVMTLGGGEGTVTSVAGIDCGATCSASVNYGTVVTLTASAADGSVFSGWAGACSGTDACVFTVTAPVSVEATFDPAECPECFSGPSCEIFDTLDCS